MEHVIIGVDPHKLSATIEVVDRYEKVLGSGRFTTDRAGYSAMRTGLDPVAWTPRKRGCSLWDAHVGGSPLSTKTKP